MAHSRIRGTADMRHWRIWISFDAHDPKRSLASHKAAETSDAAGLIDAASCGFMQAFALPIPGQELIDAP